MDNNNLDLMREDDPHDEDQNTTYAEEDSEVVAEDVAEEVAEEAAEEVAEEIAEEVAEESDEEKAKKRRSAILSSIYDLSEIFAVSIIAVIVIFSFFVRLCVVDGHSMEQTLYHGERIIAQDVFYTPKQGDIVVFHLVNDTFKRPLVKRVIATEGQVVEIDYDAKAIYVDGVLYSDEHAYFSGDRFDIRTDLDPRYTYTEGGKTFFRATVPEGMIFVLGDNRNNSTDSRSIHIGFVDVDCVLGKAVLRLKPFTIFD